MKETIATLSLLFLMLLSPASALAQGIIGSDMPKEIFGRGHTHEEIEALNAEIDRRRAIGLTTVAFALSSVCLAVYYLRRRQRKS